jgi:hypothetical protein
MKKKINNQFFMNIILILKKQQTVQISHRQVPAEVKHRKLDLDSPISVQTHVHTNTWSGVHTLGTLDIFLHAEMDMSVLHSDP